MATVLSLESSPTLPENKVETVFDARDFIYLIDRYMGYDAMKYYREIIEDYERTIAALNCEIEEMNREV